MRQRGRRVLGAVAVAAVALAGGLLAAMARIAFEQRVAGEVSSLLAASAARDPAVISEADLAGLPEPVQRWLRWAQVVGNPARRPSA